MNAHKIRRRVEPPLRIVAIGTVLPDGSVGRVELDQSGEVKIPEGTMIESLFFERIIPSVGATVTIGCNKIEWRESDSGK